MNAINYLNECSQITNYFLGNAAYQAPSFSPPEPQWVSEGILASNLIGLQTDADYWLNNLDTVTAVPIDIANDTTMTSTLQTVVDYASELNNDPSNPNANQWASSLNALLTQLVTQATSWATDAQNAQTILSNVVTNLFAEQGMATSYISACEETLNSMGVSAVIKTATTLSNAVTDSSQPIPSKDGGGILECGIASLAFGAQSATQGISAFNSTIKQRLSSNSIITAQEALNTTLNKLPANVSSYVNLLVFMTFIANVKQYTDNAVTLSNEWNDEMTVLADYVSILAMTQQDSQNKNWSKTLSNMQSAQHQWSTIQTDYGGPVGIGFKASTTPVSIPDD